MARGRLYGEHLAVIINRVIQTIDPDEREDYKNAFISGMKAYSLKPRKEGTSKNSEDVCKLESLTSVNIENPEDLVRIISEGIDLMYQKNTAKQVINGLLEKLK